jgi:integrase
LPNDVITSTHVDSDALADILKALPVAHEQPEYLAPAALGKLLQAALRHDAATFAETRAEHAGLHPRGSTRRYAPIAPFVAFVLLTGCRRGEALGLTWTDVDLEGRDAQGRTVGEIKLRAEHTKTHRARTIGLEVSPALRALLAALKLRAGRDAASRMQLIHPRLVLQRQNQPFALGHFKFAYAFNRQFRHDSVLSKRFPMIEFE